MAAAHTAVTEDVNDGNFGEGFEDVEFLSNAEVAVLLADDSNPNADQLPVITQACKDYCVEFGGSEEARTAQAVESIRMALAKLMFEVYNEDNSKTRILTGFEIVSLANLRPSSPLMAQALIPSLGDLSTEDVETILQALSQAAVSLLT